MESCTNCERPIGNLERSFDWKGNAVCQKCFDELRRPDAMEREKSTPAGADQMICPNPHCGQNVAPEWREKGNPGLLLLLFCLGIVPGLLYALFGYGKEWFCPACKGQLMPPPEIKHAVFLRQRQNA